MSNSFATPWPIALQAPLSMGFPRQEYCRELSFPSPGDLPDPGIKPASPALAGGFFAPEPVRQWKVKWSLRQTLVKWMVETFSIAGPWVLHLITPPITVSNPQTPRQFQNIS